MIFDLYVISKQSGICIYHRGFGATLVNRDLVAGLLSAMFSFMKEVRGDEIKVMVSGTSRFVFDESSMMIFVVLVDANHEGNNASAFLEGVKNLFIERYGDDKPISPLSDDDPISQNINSLLVVPARSPDSIKTPLKLSHRLSNLVASELTTQKDALTNLFDKVAESQGHGKTVKELHKKYREEIEYLTKLIEETNSG